MEFADKESSENQAKKTKSRAVKEQPAGEVPEKKTQIEEAILANSNSAKPKVSDSVDSRIQVSMFDYSPENYFSEMDAIYKLCGETEMDAGGFDQEEIERFSSKVTFLSDWRSFNYKPRTIRFSPESGLYDEKETHNDITLSQFSAALVPHSDLEAEDAVVSTDSRKDFILYVGGLVWALDWCPRPEQGTHSDTNCEFIAVAAHPPNSMHHRLGEPLRGRGMIQIWSLINCSSSCLSLQAPAGKTKKKYQKKPIAHKEDTQKRPRGRPRKICVDKPRAFASPEVQLSQALVQLPENMSDGLALEANIVNTQKNSEKDTAGKKESAPKTPGRRPRKTSVDNTLAVMSTEGQLTQALAVHPSGEHTTVGEISAATDPEEPRFLAVEFPKNMSNGSPMQEDVLNTPASHVKIRKRQRVPSEKALNADLECTISELRRRSRVKRSRVKSKVHNESGHDDRLAQNDIGGPSVAGQQENCLEKEVNVLESDVPDDSVSNVSDGSCNALKSIVLPRVVLCLGHDGMVAWDVKWRPRNRNESVNKHIMGYLAVALGNGSVEVWEIPSPQIIRCIYASQDADSVDPRFTKLEPIFRSSHLKCGNRQSMPVTVEWSASPPHDLILGGCHDGMVALWKFCANASSQDARPLLCFRAETSPIRALSWAPSEGDPDSANVIVTAGHGGLKFWDLRDPFRPLWDANPSQRFIYSVDWLPDPRCVLVSYDDGTLRMVCLKRAACDVPVTGEPLTGTLQQGVHSFCCSSFAIWSIHASRLTGMVAYCCADGTVMYFQLTHRAVDGDPGRNRPPHFLCGSLVDEKSAVAINTHLPTSPHLMKKSATEWANTPRSAKSLASSRNQVKGVRKETKKTQNQGDEILVLSCDEDDTKEDANGKGKAGKPKTANKEEEVNGGFEVPPSKIVPMHKVRWNMNKGSEKWLCYGGAAGIVRCQEIVARVYDKKLLR